jgi:hypothetical protein
MPHIGVERLRAGYGEHDGAEQDKTAHRGRRQQPKTIAGVDRGENLGGVLDDLGESEQTDDCKPHRHHRPKRRPTSAVPRRCTKNRPSRSTIVIGSTP